MKRFACSVVCLSLHINGWAETAGNAQSTERVVASKKEIVEALKSGEEKQLKKVLTGLSTEQLSQTLAEAKDLLQKDQSQLAALEAEVNAGNYNDMQAARRVRRIGLEVAGASGLLLLGGGVFYRFKVMTEQNMLRTSSDSDLSDLPAKQKRILLWEYQTKTNNLFREFARQTTKAKSEWWGGKPAPVEADFLPTAEEFQTLSPDSLADKYYENLFRSFRSPKIAFRLRPVGATATTLTVAGTAVMVLGEVALQFISDDGSESLAQSRDELLAEIKRLRITASLMTNWISYWGSDLSPTS
ncbi:MAG: hypothetical protein C5B49_10060 [Bdellovibrio sp.]|nr:MAG: hypothetical protein C5B49_10060 [Bdellovibrio sp.]